MNLERVLALDISSKTGWVSMISTDKGIELEGYGTLPQYHAPDSPYPGSYVDWAYMCFGKIVELVDRFAPDVLVIEETSGGSKSGMSQKILEYIHFLVARLIRDTGIKSVYFMTETWRREVGCLMTKDEKKRNKEVKDYKKKHEVVRAKDKDGKLLGKITRKHVNVRKANEIFGLNLKIGQNDLADSLLLGYCYHLRRVKNSTKGDKL